MPTDNDESLHKCRYAVPPDSLAIEPSHSDITASTTYDIAAMSTTPVTYRGSVVDMDGELQVSDCSVVSVVDMNRKSEHCIPTASLHPS